MSEDIISYEEFQKLQELENVSAEVIRVEAPDGQLLPRVKLTLQVRQLGPSPPGNGLTTRRILVVRPEYAKVVVDQIAEQIDLAERLGSSK